MRRSDVVIIGGGIVGLLTSYFLSRKNYDVKIVTESDTANTASWVNAGYIAASFGHPIPDVESLPHIIKLTFSKDSPIKVSPTYLLKSLTPSSWIWRFIKHSRKRSSTEYFKTIRTLCFEGADLLEKIIESSGIDVFVGKTILEVYLHEDVMLENLEKNREHLRGGIRSLTRSECLELEPLLSDKVVGGIIFEDDKYVNPVELMEKLTEFTRKELGVEFMYDRAVSLEVERGKVVGVRLSNGEVLSASDFVACNGMGAVELLFNLGLKLPLAAGFGYTIVTEPYHLRMGRAVVCGEFRLATSQTRDGRFRASGYFELGGNPSTVLEERCLTIQRKASQYLPALGGLNMVEKRFGARPCTPDGLPYVGGVGVSGLTVNVGHCRLGLTTGAATAKLVCELLEGVKNPLTEVLDPTRMLEA